MEVYVTGHSHNATSTLHYLYYGAYNTKQGNYNQAHTNANGITKRNELISGYQCHQSYNGALKDFHHYLHQKPNNKVQTLNIILSFSKQDFDFRKPKDCTEASVIAQDFAHRAFPENIGVMGFQEDNTNAIPHVHLDLCSIKMTPPYNTITGREYGIYRLRRIGRQCVNDFNHGIVNGRHLKHPFSHQISGITENKSHVQRQEPSFRQAKIIKAINSVLYKPAVNSPSKFRNALKPYGIRASFKRRNSSRRRYRKRKGRYKRSGLTFRYVTKTKSGKTRRHYIKASALSNIDPIYSLNNITKQLSVNKIVYRKRRIEDKRYRQQRKPSSSSATVNSAELSSMYSLVKSNKSYHASVSASQSLSLVKSASKSVSASSAVAMNLSASRASSASYSTYVSQSASTSTSISASASIQSASMSVSASMSTASVSASASLSASQSSQSVAKRDYRRVSAMMDKETTDTDNFLTDLNTDKDRHISAWNFHNAVPVLAAGSQDKEVLKPIHKSYRKMNNKKDRHSLHDKVHSLLQSFKHDFCVGRQRLIAVFDGIRSYCQDNYRKGYYLDSDHDGNYWRQPYNVTLDAYKQYTRPDGISVWGIGKKRRIKRVLTMSTVIDKFSFKFDNAVHQGLSPIYSHFSNVRHQKIKHYEAKARKSAKSKYESSVAQSRADEQRANSIEDSKAHMNYERSVASSKALDRQASAKAERQRSLSAYYQSHPEARKAHEAKVQRQREIAIRNRRNQSQGFDWS